MRSFPVPSASSVESDAWYLNACRWQVAQRRYVDRQRELGAHFGCILVSDLVFSARTAALHAVEGGFNAELFMPWTTSDAVAAELAAIDAEASVIARGS